MTGHPSDVLFEEVAYIAYHFHWDRDRILDLAHPERQRWVQEIAAINRRLSEQASAESAPWS
jgi:hypothetical protein